MSKHEQDFGGLEFDISRPLIEQLPGYRPGFKLYLPPTMRAHLAAQGYDLRDIKAVQPIPVHRAA